MQIVWTRPTGRVNLNFNYTYGKAMGIVGFYDQFNLSDNYGVLANNRTHMFNAAYTFDLGNLHSEQGPGRLCQWLAALRHHAASERPQPVGDTRVRTSA